MSRTASRVQQILSDLVAIESVNPLLPGGQRGEVEVAAYVDAFCERLGLEKVPSGGLPGRPNSVWRLAPAGVVSGGGLMLEAHMDTVTLDNMPNGTTPRVVGDRLYGRGACDTKGSLAAMMAAVEVLAQNHRDQLPCAVLLAAVVDEECRQGGAGALVEVGIRPEAAVVGEPTLLRPVIAHKGVVRFLVVTKGRAAHTSRPEGGDNAILQMTDVIRELESYMREQQLALEHPLCGRPVHTISMIHGGRQYNFVPDECSIGIDRRTLPNEVPDQVLEGYRRFLDDINRRLPHVRVEMGTVERCYPGCDTPTDDPIVHAARQVVGLVTGDDSVAGAPFGTDASTYWGQARIPCVVLGPGDIAQAHTADEWIALDQLTKAVDVYVQMALRFGR